jgi:hypothetical protein
VATLALDVPEQINGLLFIMSIHPVERALGLPNTEYGGNVVVKLFGCTGHDVEVCPLQ